MSISSDQASDHTASSPPEPPSSADQAPAWLDATIVWARERRATDLHFFPGDGASAALWARVDGDLIEAARYPVDIHARLIARLKVLGRCSDYDGELVQEGRFSLNGSGSDSGQARLSVVPTIQGEKAVVRLLASVEGRLTLDCLGFHSALCAALRRAMDRPQGLILAVGPSGCGKSTTLYALIDDLFQRAGRPLSILTIEDPVEQTLPCAAQIGADPARGLGFPQGLRAILRQDPEVIMIGEIRDAETAEAALQAALTGHQLLSSMHTLTASEALVRLRQMGAPAYVIASALAGVLNTRLVKLLCERCRTRRPASPDERRAWPECSEWDEPVLADASGCPVCLGSGRLGRAGLAEWVRPTEETALALADRLPARAIAATLDTVVSAREGGLEMLRAGAISADETLRLSGLESLAAL